VPQQRVSISDRQQGLTAQPAARIEWIIDHLASVQHPKRQLQATMASDIGTVPRPSCQCQLTSSIALRSSLAMQALVS
jgi:hypothetical protein